MMNRSRKPALRRRITSSTVALVVAFAAYAIPAAQPAAMETWLLECPDLKPVHRTCVMLRYVYGMTRTEIAKQTGLSETQVKGHLQYGLKLLRQAYGKSSKR